MRYYPDIANPPKPLNTKPARATRIATHQDCFKPSTVAITVLHA